jgi:hypothetical protein
LEGRIILTNTDVVEVYGKDLGSKKRVLNIFFQFFVRVLKRCLEGWWNRQTQVV